MFLPAVLTENWGRFRLGLFLTGAVFEWAVFFFFLYSTDTFRCILVLAHRSARNVYIHVQMWFKSSMYSAGKKNTLKAHGSLSEGERQYFPLEAVDGCM